MQGRKSSGLHRFFATLLGVKIIDLSLIPIDISFEDLVKENVLLVSDEEIQLFHQYIIKDGVYNKKQVAEKIGISISKDDDKFPWKIFRLDGIFWAIYKGNKSREDHHLLGQGWFGKVKYIQNLDTGEFFAYKILPVKKYKSSQEAIDLVSHELDVLRERHETAQSTLLTRNSKWLEKQFEFVMNLAEGMDMEKFLEKESVFINKQYDRSSYEIQFLIPTILRLEMALQIVNVYLELQVNHWLHRDIKPANVKLDFDRMVAKIVDFGQAVKTDESGICLSSDLVGNAIGLHLNNRQKLITIIKSRKRDEKFSYNDQTENYGIAILLANWFLLMETLPNISPHEIGQLENRSYIYPDMREVIYQTLPEEQLANMLDMLHRLTRNEIDLIHFKNELESLKNDFISKYPDQAKLKVGIVDVREIFNSSNPISPGLIAKIKSLNVDTIWLVNTATQYEDNVIIHAVFRRTLQLNEIRVGGAVFIDANKDDIETSLKDHLEQFPIKFTCQWINVKPLLENSNDMSTELRPYWFSV